MIGLVVIVLTSWTLLRLVANTDLSVLYLYPTNLKILHFFIGFLLAATACVAYHLLTVLSVNNSWLLRDAFTLKQFFASLWWTLRSVLFEELLFRGALLYLAIKKLGAKAACLLSAVCFGASHFITYNLLNNPVQMAIVFTMTGLVGFVLARAFVVTRSLYLPIGLHLGWNLFNIVVFSNGPLGPQLLMKANSNRPDGWLSLAVFLFQVIALPLSAIVYVTWLDRKANRTGHNEALANVWS